MIHLDVRTLSDCRRDCLDLFEQARALRGKDKTPLYKTEVFKKVAAEIRQRVPQADNREILAFVLKKFGQELKKT